MNEDEVANIEAEFAKVLANPIFTSGKQGEHTFSFDDAEKNSMKEQVKQYVKELSYDLIVEDLKALSGDKPEVSSDDDDDSPQDSPLIADDSLLSQQLLALVKSRAQKYILATTGKTVPAQLPIVGKDPITINLPEFKYPLAIRLRAALLLQPGRSKNVGWGFAERLQIIQQLNDIVDATFGVPADSVDLSLLSPAVSQWLGNFNILSHALSGK